MKLRKIVPFLIIIVLVVFCIARIGLIIVDKMLEEKYEYSQEYVPGQGNIQGNVDADAFLEASEDFAIGANSNGYAVFKDPDKAFATLKESYSDGIQLIQEEFDLLPFMKLNYSEYKTYGWQVTTGTGEEQEQAHFVTKFLDIYENSFVD